MVMSEILTFVFLIIGIGTVLSSGYMGRKAKDKISDLTSVMNSNEAKIGMVGTKDMMQNVSGVARLHEETILSPLQGAEALAYESKISTKSGITSSSIYSDQKAEIFKLVSGDEEVLVDPTHATMHMNKGVVPINLPSVQNIISDQSIGVNPRNLSVKEGLIQDGDPVFLYGQMEEMDGRGRNRTIGGKRDSEFIISNEDKSELKKYLFVHSAVYVMGALGLIGAGLSVILFSAL